MESIPKVAIIGCGLIGRKRSKALGGAALVYACDVNIEAARAVASNSRGCTAISDFRTALADDDIDAVIVSTSNWMLAPIGIAAADAGKQVLLEKPGALTAKQLRDVQKAAVASRVAVKVGYNLRFHPGIMKAKSLVEAKAIGQVSIIRGRYGHGARKNYDREWRADPTLSGGGELLDQGVHLIDLSSWFLGDLVKVEGHCSTYFWDMVVDDNAFVHVYTATGSMAWLHVSCTEWKNTFSFELQGSEGAISVDGLGGSYGTETVRLYKADSVDPGTDCIAWEYRGSDDSWERDTRAFLSAMQEKSETEEPLGSEIKTLEIVERIYELNHYPLSRSARSPSK